ncbi:hypothetical protein C1752_14876 [Acaryochloris thomasi RCC1774]|uniref:Uncharacterized protein n=1 Tax=Acaryochloris thomasi RCC1774 TaxID=1764569 RepID=A0A2W1J6M3_9CYAN|nr:hypothetical protein C1752_14876 [Acaryochloris thomasi RCC1774]
MIHFYMPTTNLLRVLVEFAEKTEKAIQSTDKDIFCQIQVRDNKARTTIVYGIEQDEWRNETMAKTSLSVFRSGKSWSLEGSWPLLHISKQLAGNFLKAITTILPSGVRQLSTLLGKL